MRSSTETLIAAMRILSRDIRSTDGVANAAIREAAERLAELQTVIANARKLSEDWKRTAKEVENEWYNDSQSIYRITEELDEILEKDGP